VGHKVVGEIIAEVDGDLYVDFGGKFHGVVPKPHKDGDRYTKGVKVNIIINDLEMTHHFLGKSCDTTLLEADIDLIGIKDEQIKTSYTTDTYYEENEISYF
jgi:small subunit ribosomal protein S28